MKDKEVEVALERALRFYVYGDENVKCFSFYRATDPILQEGPCCGLVALAMGAKLVSSCNITFDEIFRTAKEMKFTLCGEMFSAANMADLANSVFGFHAKVLSDLTTFKARLVEHILNGLPVLIPYDADRNHTPCRRRGHYAHWAVVTGVCLLVPESEDDDDASKPEVCHFDSGEHLKKYVEQCSKILVYARHGKSRYLAVWSLDELLQSNSNLYEIHSKHDANKMVIPSVDVLGGLRDKAVLLSL